jgi:hypothetical protein
VRRLAVPICTLLLALAGCGGGDGDDTLTKSEAVEEGDKICADLDRQLERVERPESLAQLGTYIGEVERIARSGLRRFRELKLSGGDKRELDAYLGEVERTVQIAGFIKSAANQRKEQEARVQLGLLEQQSDKADAAAKRFGFKECGSDDA